MPGPTEDILPDEVLDKHFDEQTAPKPTADEEDTLAFDDDTDESTVEDFAEDTDADDAGEEESDEELEEDDLDDEDELEDDTEEEEEDDLDEEDEDVEDISEVLSKEERELIESTPELKKAHRLMQADYTRKTTRVARREKDVEAKQAKIDAFAQHVQTPEGAVEFITNTVMRDPTIAAKAFESIATSEGATAFLVEVGLADTDAFERAYDRVMELNEDEAERTRHTRKREAEREDFELKAKRDRMVRDQFEHRLREIQDTTERLSERAKVAPEDVGEVIGAVKDAIRKKGQAKGEWDLNNDEIKGIVLQVRKDIRKREEKVRRRLESESLKKDRQRVRNKAKRGNRPPAPRASSSSRAQPKPPKQTGDPDRDLDRAIEYAFDRL